MPSRIWRLLRQRKELARVISREVQNSVESGKGFVEEIAPPAYQSLAGYLDRGMNRGVLRTSQSPCGRPLPDRNPVVVSP
jgi:hypothetical protein